MSDESYDSDNRTEDDNFNQSTSEDVEEEKLEVETEERVKKDVPIVRIPWREFIRNQFRKLVGTIIVVGLMVWIINLSDNISPVANQSEQAEGDLNPDTIIALDETTQLQLAILSSIVFFGILVFFSKLVFFDHKEDFGIESYKSIKALVFILFDVALTKVYLEILPVYAIWALRAKTNLVLDFKFLEAIAEGTDRIAYAEIRGLLFLILFSFMLSFPLAMTIVILTRFGRQQVKIRKEKPREKYSFRDWLKFFATLPLEFIILAIFFAISSLDPGVPIQFLFLLAFILIGLWWLTQVLILISRAIRGFGFLIYSRAAMILPIVFLFYILPGLIWATWDLFVLFSTNDVTNTIYESSKIRNQATIDPIDSWDLGTQELLEFYFQTLLFNLGDFFRIIELDFVFVIGVSSIVLGFAEGYSVVAIVRSITRGISIAKSGRVASRSAPKMIVLSSRLVLLLTWFSLLYDKGVVLWNTVVISFNLPLPELNVPRVFELLFGVTFSLEDLGGVFFAVSLLVVPLYFIITSSFKFLSVSIVADRTKHDTQAFFFLISSAFILIVTQILADIAALPDFAKDGGAQNKFLPLQGLNIPDTFIPFISKIFENLEAIGFYAGALVSLVILLKLLIMKIFKR
ncbi:MAG: hypothetical protein ACW99A_02090 [Candidatus Kariarchaeaceae archaeon]